MALTDLKQLSVTERLRLLEVIWDSLGTDAESLPMTEAQRTELDRRLDAHERGEDQGYTWEEVLARVKGEG
ncbi:MAG: addiction module protein [Armatimonadetes bacterium]|nr:addiction module protein [Armatimonadota bacterium]